MKRRVKQVRRMMKLVQALKRGEKLTANSFARKLEREDYITGGDLAACSKTIKRDIALLRKDFRAPILYDPVEGSYCLVDPTWQFPYLMLDPEEFFASMLSMKLASDRVPESLKDVLEEVESIQMVASDTADYDPELMKSLVVRDGSGIEVPAVVFEAVIEAWKGRRQLRIVYRRPQDKEGAERDIEIHALFVADGAWYARAFCRLRDGLRNFALHRIEKAEVLTERFQRDDTIVQEVEAGKSFTYPAIENVVLHCSLRDAPTLREREWFPGQEAEVLPDGVLELRYPTVTPIIVNWVLSQAGAVQVKEPATLREQVRACSARMAADHGAGEEKT